MLGFNSKLVWGWPLEAHHLRGIHRWGAQNCLGSGPYLLMATCQNTILGIFGTSLLLRSLGEVGIGFLWVLRRADLHHLKCVGLCCMVRLNIIWWRLKRHPSIRLENIPQTARQAGSALVGGFPFVAKQPPKKPQKDTNHAKGQENKPLSHGQGWHHPSLYGLFRWLLAASGQAFFDICYL